MHVTHIYIHGWRDALDPDERWITMNSAHILVEGHGPNMTVKAGAGGKLTGQSLAPSASHAEAAIAKAGGREDYNSAQANAFARSAPAAEQAHVVAKLGELNKYQASQLSAQLLALGKTPEVRQAAFEHYMQNEASETNKKEAAAAYTMASGGDTGKIKSALGQFWQGSGSTSPGSLVSGRLNQLVHNALADAFTGGNNGTNPALVAALHELRSETTKFYEARGKKALTLYRGVKHEGGLSNPAQSWTESPEVANKFATKVGKTVKREVPLKNILFSYESHPKLLSRLAREKEAIVINAA